MPAKAANTVNTSSFDGLRGLAALVVALFHVCDFTYSQLSVAGLTAVPIFYLLSGFVLELNYGHQFCDGNYSAHDYLLFMAKRMARIYPMYFLLNFVCVPVFPLVTQDFTFTKYVCSTFLLTNILPLGMEPPLQVSWTISTVFGLYLLFPLLSTLLRYLDSANIPRSLYLDSDNIPSKPNPTRLMTIALLSGAVYFLGGLIALVYKSEGEYYNVTATAFLVFLAGMCIGRFRRLQAQANLTDEETDEDRRWTMSSDRAFSLVFALFLASTILISTSRSSESRMQLEGAAFDGAPDMERYASYGASFLAPIPFILGVYALTAKQGATGTFDAVVLQNPTLKWFGGISLTFYLCHAIPMYYVYQLIGKTGVASATCIVYSLLFSFPAAWVLTVHVEEPMNKRILQLLPRQRGRQVAVRSLLGQFGDDQKRDLEKSLVADAQTEPEKSQGA